MADIGTVAGGDTLPRELVLSESEQPERPFGFYGGKIYPQPWQTRRKGAQQRQGCGTTEIAKKGDVNKNREYLAAYRNALAAAAEGGGKAVKTVGNDVVASGRPSAPLIVSHSRGGGSKIMAVNVEDATGGGSGGGMKYLPSGEGGGGSGGGILIGAGAAIVRGIGPFLNQGT